MEPIFLEPSTEENQRLAKQIIFIDDIMKNQYTYNLNQSVEDLIYLQKIIDDKLFSKDKTWELQSLGVILGRVLIRNNDNLDWWMIEDEYGKDPTIRYKKTTFCINVMTMISKRIENDEKVMVSELYEFLIKHIEENKNRYI